MRGVGGETVLVAPEPEEDAVQKWFEVGEDASVLGVEGAEGLVVAEEDDWPAVRGVREDDLLQPFEVLGVDADEAGEEEFEDRERPRKVAGVDRDDPPMAVLEREVARLLADGRERPGE